MLAEQVRCVSTPTLPISPPCGACPSGLWLTARPTTAHHRPHSPHPVPPDLASPPPTSPPAPLLKTSSRRRRRRRRQSMHLHSRPARSLQRRRRRARRPARAASLVLGSRLAALGTTASQHASRRPSDAALKQAGWHCQRRRWLRGCAAGLCSHSPFGCHAERRPA